MCGWHLLYDAMQWRCNDPPSQFQMMEHFWANTFNQQTVKLSQSVNNNAQTSHTCKQFPNTPNHHQSENLFTVQVATMAD